MERDCIDGEAGVVRLEHELAHLGKDAAPFLERARSLRAELNTLEHNAARKLPFAPVCCDIARVGRAARALAVEALAAAGREVPEDLAKQAEEDRRRPALWKKVLFFVGVFGVTGLAAWGGYKLYRRVRRPSRPALPPAEPEPPPLALPEPVLADAGLASEPAAAVSSPERDGKDG